MKNTLLGVIAVCLFMITLKLYIPEANAEEDTFSSDSEFEEAVKLVVSQSCTSSHFHTVDSHGHGVSGYSTSYVGKNTNRSSGWIKCQSKDDWIGP